MKRRRQRVCSKLAFKELDRGIHGCQSPERVDGADQGKSELLEKVLKKDRCESGWKEAFAQHDLDQSTKELQDRQNRMSGVAARP